MSEEQHILPSGVSWPRAIGEITREFESRIREGRLEGYLPISTGFPERDEIMGGGYLAGCLTLLSGRQNIGKTIDVLQGARNVALQGDVACLVCYEHDEVHLLHRLLCMESYLSSRDGSAVTLAQIREAVLEAVPPTPSGRKYGTAAPDVQGLQAVLSAYPSARRAFDEAILEYLDRLYLIRGDPIKTTVQVLRTYASKLQEDHKGRAVMFIDYLQKVPLSLDSWGMDRERETVMVTRSLKDLTLDYGIPVVAISALDTEGLKKETAWVEDMQGGPETKYEPDTAIMMHAYWDEDKRHVGFAFAKNRAGPTRVEVVYNLVGQHFCFDPEPVAVREYVSGE